MTDERPIACSLTPAALQARRTGLLPGLLGLANSREDLRDGYRVRFDGSGDILATIATTLDAERQCCRFLRFTLTIEPDGGPIVLDITGPTGTREFLDALLVA